MRGATGRGHQGPLGPSISTHAPLAGRDGRGRASRVPPRGNFNPRAPCGARPPRLGGSDQTAQISTHAPLAGRDFRGVWVNYLRSVNFNPRAPCGARLIAGSTRQSTAEFQPTRPLRGATRHGAGVPRAGGISTHAPLAGRDPAKIAVGIIFEISTHAPLAGRDISNLRIYDTPRISTHAPLAGRDGGGKTASCGELIFQPTRPLRGATTVQVDTMDMQQDFNPRAPCGARQQERFELYLIRDFNPRAPCGARRDQARDATGNAISTHAPLAGRDIVRSTAAIRVKNFNPRAPCGARPQQNEPRMSDLKISTHAPLAGRDLFRQDAVEKGRISTHAPLAGRDLAGYDALSARNRISTHAPLAGRDHVQQEER